MKTKRRIQSKKPVGLTTLILTIVVGVLLLAFLGVNWFVVYNGAKEILSQEYNWPIPQKYAGMITSTPIVFFAAAIATTIVFFEIATGFLLEWARSKARQDSWKSSAAWMVMIAIILACAAFAGEFSIISLRATAMEQNIMRNVSGLTAAEMEAKTSEVRIFRLTFILLSSFSMALIAFLTAVTTYCVMRLSPVLDSIWRTLVAILIGIAIVSINIIAAVVVATWAVVTLAIFAVCQMLLWTFDLLNGFAEQLIRRPCRWVGRQWQVLWQPQVASAPSKRDRGDDAPPSSAPDSGSQDEGATSTIVEITRKRQKGDKDEK